jgi:hypothetical protein
MVMSASWKSRWGVLVRVEGPDREGELTFVVTENVEAIGEAGTSYGDVWV